MLEHFGLPGQSASPEPGRAQDRLQLPRRLWGAAYFTPRESGKKSNQPSR